MSAFFHTILYVPIYNLLIFFVDKLPGYDIGIAVILVTLIIRLIIMPLSFAAQRTTRAMKLVEPEMAAIKEQYKDDKELQAKETFALYKRYGINPFASFLVILIQLPIIICLYWVFRSKSLLMVNSAILYSFVHAPAQISPLFLGIFAVAGSSLVLAALAAITQFLLAIYAIPTPDKNAAPGMQADMAKAMTMQMRYVFPLLMGAIAFTSGAIALYFITSNIFGIVQEFFVRKAFKSTTPTGTSADKGVLYSPLP